MEYCPDNGEEFLLERLTEAKRPHRPDHVLVFGTVVDPWDGECATVPRQHPVRVCHAQPQRWRDGRCQQLRAAWFAGVGWVCLVEKGGV